MEKVIQFLKENPVFYFATVEEGLPKVRPFGFFMVYEGKLYFAIGKHKKTFQQILKNPHVEICTSSKDNEWIRIRGEVIVDDNSEVLSAAFETMPMLKQIYNDTTGQKLGMIYMKDPVAEIADMKGKFEEVQL
ncbi:pyridoxamine 5'-phosphate oxidase family protein [Sinanaerobacter sp. ZZT-01]|uniref:pyridoxamine 5'-phosphate oxidase family protein n=1 Tax=Sinanaerobacter sp. ZZT-01 TaxID=3111540 RepID=UPI002D765CAF|nr:pyridoxamine 5'-phosphate oxidase family protein [Sinanaerobacter sp. ZZT-01]WRR93181.1 pyridoxamine 5'-phosphate oxidase family protein [Sinanaerobacter sp. ZZT-01]